VNQVRKKLNERIRSQGQSDVDQKKRINNSAASFKLSGSLLNLLENIRNLRYCHIQFHGAFSFLIRFMGINPFKGKAPFFFFLAPYEGTQNILRYPCETLNSNAWAAMVEMQP
jgi:hypothetical protein